MADVVRRPDEGSEALEEKEFFPAGAAAASGAFAAGIDGTSGDPEHVEGGEAKSSGSMLRLTVMTFLENKVALAGMIILLFLVLFCFVGPHIYITNQVSLNPAINNYGPSGSHILGTDGEGFDVLGRLMVAGQSSIEIGLAAGLCAAIFGTLYGAVSAVAGGLVDAVMMRIVDALYSLPALFLLILLAAIFSPNLPLMIFVLAFISWLAGPPGARRGAQPAHAGVRPGGEGCRRHPEPDRAAPYRPQRHWHDHGEHFVPYRRLDPRARSTQLPRSRPPGHDTHMGWDALQRDPGHLRRVLVAAVPRRHRDRVDGRGLQLLGRRLARHPRRPATAALRALLPT